MRASRRWASSTANATPVELDCRDRLFDGIKGLPRLGRKARREPYAVDPDAGAVSETALTRDVAIEMGDNGLPSTFVPGRNLIFLTMAATLAYRRGLTHIVGGMCETDYSGYPDCRDQTIPGAGNRAQPRHGPPGSCWIRR